MIARILSGIASAAARSASSEGSPGRASVIVRTTGAERGTVIEPRPSVRSVNASAANPIATARSSWSLAS